MKTKKLSWWKALVIATVGALKLASNAPAQETGTVEKPLETAKQEFPINVTSKTDYFSKYIFRGMNFSDKPVVQENVLINYKDLTFWVFGNYDTQTRKINEEDLIIDYTNPINKNKDLLFSTGWAVFTFPNTEFKNTQEVYAALSLVNNKYLNPSIFFAHDFKDGKGNYLEASLSRGFNLGKIPLSAVTKLAYNDHYYREKSGLSHLELGLGLPIKLGKNTTLSPSITRSESLDKDFKSETYWRICLEHKF